MTTPRLVLLHGVGLDHTMWDPVRDLLRERVESIITPDLLGHGGGPPASERVDLAQLAAPVVEQLRPGDHLIGFSLGALVAQHIARRKPELVATLVSVSSVCQRTDAERAAVLDRLAAARTDFAASVQASLERWYAGTGVSARTIKRTRDVLLANDRRSYLACYRVFATADAEIAPELPDITVPTLALTGELDTGSTPAMTRRLAAAIPDCRAVIVPRARHMLPVQLPQVLATTIGTFIEEHCLV